MVRTAIYTIDDCPLNPAFVEQLDRYFGKDRLHYLGFVLGYLGRIRHLRKSRSKDFVNLVAANKDEAIIIKPTVGTDEIDRILNNTCLSKEAGQPVTGYWASLNSAFFEGNQFHLILPSPDEYVAEVGGGSELRYFITSNKIHIADITTDYYAAYVLVEWLVRSFPITRYLCPVPKNNPWMSMLSDDFLATIENPFSPDLYQWLIDINTVSLIGTLVTTNETQHHYYEKHGLDKHSKVLLAERRYDELFEYIRLTYPMSVAQYSIDKFVELGPIVDDPKALIKPKTKSCFIKQILDHPTLLARITHNKSLRIGLEFIIERQTPQPMTKSAIVNKFELFVPIHDYISQTGSETAFVEMLLTLYPNTLKMNVNGTLSTGGLLQLTIDELQQITGCLAVVASISYA